MKGWLEPFHHACEHAIPQDLFAGTACHHMTPIVRA
jgi:hypothetical protein